MSIYKAFKNIWMIVLNILGYFGRNKQNGYASLRAVTSYRVVASHRFLPGDSGDSL